MMPYRWTGSVVLAAAVGMSADAGQAQTSRPAGKTFREIYAAQRPDFLEWERVRANDPYQLSLQPWFYNTAYLEQDFRAEALVTKADELAAQGNYRTAMKLYHEVLTRFPDDLWRVQEDGIFVRTALYAQRQLLRMPTAEILYYRTLHDAEARTLFERAKRYYSLLDFAEVAERYLATSYGDNALWELGNAALDQGQHARALACFGQIRDYCALSDIPPGDLALRLAQCYRALGREADYRAARQAALDGDGQLDRARREAFLRHLDEPPAGKSADAMPGVQPRGTRDPGPNPLMLSPDFRPFRQARKPEFISMGDYDAFPDLSVPIDRQTFVWSEPLPDARGQWYVRALPWIAGNYVYYQHHNGIFCRSLLTGKLNWSYVPGGLLDWFDVEGLNRRPHPPFGGAKSPDYHGESDLLVHDGLVFASIVKDGPSLVALDAVTGQVRWTAGAITSAAEIDRNTRYLTAPAPGPNVVYAPFVQEDIEGQAHLTSVVGVRCFDSQTGRVIWSRTICHRTPPKFSTSAFVRRIRIYGTQPTVAGGVVYYATNAGVVAALDALSGSILWVTRYPHAPDIHDLLKKHGPLWFSRPPLLLDGRLFVTPVDSGRLMCLDPETGQVNWSRAWRDAQTLVGVDGQRDLVVTGSGGLWGVDPATGETRWSRPGAPADLDRPLGGGAVIARPILTRTDKIYFNTAIWSGVYGEQYWDIRSKKTLAQRYYYHPDTWGALWNFNRDVRDRARRENREPDPEEFLANTTDPFKTYHRLPFERFGTVFELEVSPERVSLWYDRAAVARAVAGQDTPQALYHQAELREIEGDRVGAIGLYERALAALPAWSTPQRTEVNRQLFRLYRRQAEAAMRAADLQAAETFVRKMSSAATTSDDEILTILSLAEVFEKQGRPGDAAAALTGAIKHYSTVRFGVPALLVGDSDALKATAEALLQNLAGKAPRQFYAPEFALAVKAAEALLDNYFSVISPLEPEVDVETPRFAGLRLQRLLENAPPAFRAEREGQAAQAFQGLTDEAAIYRRIAEFPGTKAAQAALDDLIGRLMTLAGPDRRMALWRAYDTARLNGLTVPEAVERICNIEVRRPPPAPLRPPYVTATTTLACDPETVLRLLDRDGEADGAGDLALVGLRSKRRHANKFGVLCWDLAKNERRWETGDIRLKDKGDEEGFEKYFVRGDRVIVHGWYDVLCLGLADGAERWRFRVPHDFRIRESASAEDLLVLADNHRTLAVHLDNGRLVWEANETGGVYVKPILRDNLLATVRRNPSAVTFRSLGTGRLLNTIRLPSLTEATGNPAAAWDERRVPVGLSDDLLLLTDGWDFIGVDLALRKVRWQRRIADIDRGGGDPAPFRFWLTGDAAVVLKPEYDSTALTVIDPAEGTIRWQRSEAKNPGVPFNAAVGAEGVFGLHYTADDPTGVRLLAYALADGQERFSRVQRGAAKPSAWLDDRTFGAYVVVRVSDEQKRTVMIVDAATGKTAAETAVQGYGDWGRYGQVSLAVRPPYIAILSDKDLTVLRPQNREQ